MNETLKGKIFYANWGYEQDNASFFKVINVSPSGKTLKVVELKHKIVEKLNNMAEMVVPVDEPCYPSKVHTVRVKEYRSEPCFNVDKIMTAFPWDHTPKEQNHYH